MLACAALLAVPALVWSQVPASTYEVRKGDTLSEIARKTKHDGVNRNQMALGIHRANRGAFSDGNINLLRVGQILAIPGRDEFAAINPAMRYQEGLALERRGDERGR